MDSILRFQEYLRIKTDHPSPDYDSAQKFLRQQAMEIGLEYNLIDLEEPALFVVILTWRGSQPSKPSLMLNSHIDVVPVDREAWSCDPFEAELQPDERIIARGSQDMKCVGMQYLEAIRNLQRDMFSPERTIHVTFVPDEEVGGEKGMKAFVETPYFTSLNVGFGLDEGGPFPSDQFVVFNEERCVWQLEIKVRGRTGHALYLHDDTAAAKALKIQNALNEFRNSEKRRLEQFENPDLIGYVTSINMTLIEGGLQTNVIAPEIKMTYDVRLSTSTGEERMMQVIEDACKDAGEGVTVTFTAKESLSGPNPAYDNNLFWTTFKSTLTSMGYKIAPTVMPAVTDARFLRAKGIPVLGFSPMNNTPVLVHDHDEYLSKDVFLRGISIYENIIKNLSLLKDE